MDKFKTFFISAIMISVFIFAFISFSAQFAIDNGNNVSILNDDSLNRTYANISQQLSSIYNDSDSQKTNWIKDLPIIGGGDNPTFPSLTGAIKVFTTGIIGMYNLIITFISEILGVPTIVLNSFLAIALLTLVLLGWRVWKIGE